MIHELNYLIINLLSYFCCFNCCINNRYGFFFVFSLLVGAGLEKVSCWFSNKTKTTLEWRYWYFVQCGLPLEIAGRRWAWVPPTTCCELPFSISIGLSRPRPILTIVGLWFGSLLISFENSIIRIDFDSEWICFRNNCQILYI